MASSEVVTNGIRVEVESSFSPERSSPAASEWFFLYEIRITNETEARVQLRSRHWIITDATGRQQEVRGEGVVGEQPVLDPGESFQYTSGCPLSTPFGSMEGSYEFVAEERGNFTARIARFELREPNALH